MTYDPLAALRHYIYRNYPSPIHEEMSKEEILTTLEDATRRLLKSKKSLQPGQLLSIDAMIITHEVRVDRVRGATFLQQRGQSDEDDEAMLASVPDETKALMLLPRAEGDKEERA